MQFTFPLVGVSFRPAEIKTFIQKWGYEIPYEALTFVLEREPGNLYDENAIKILVLYGNDPGPQFCGYVAKEFAEEIAPLLDSGYTVDSIKIVSFQGTYKPILEAELNLPVGAVEESEDDVSSDGEVDEYGADSEAAPTSAD